MGDKSIQTKRNGSDSGATVRSKAGQQERAQRNCESQRRMARQERMNRKVLAKSDIFR